jgi:hypothetical protein
MQNLPQLEKDKMQEWINSPRGLRLFLKGLKGTVPSADLDYNVHVDRSKSEETLKQYFPIYGQLIYPDLQAVGPTVYDLRKVKIHSHDSLRAQSIYGLVNGPKVFEDIVSRGNLKDCLAYEDLVAIKQMDLDVFLRVFDGKHVAARRSIRRDFDGYMYVPYLFQNYGEQETQIKWVSVEGNLYNFMLEVHFP